ncbi:MAG: hypothetical protein A2Y69_11330 [Candidatus Aminicenantes bacterium RBG_13_59_9]|nr:MAG: hypothetical protein A2Y69_11330 [Candidatus Aminicenantes bacterium RBG_13_59_9]
MRFQRSMFAVVFFFFATVILAAQQTQTAALPPYTVLPIELSSASCSGFEGKPLSGLILQIENAQPDLELVMDASSIKIKTLDGGWHSPVLMFYVNILKGKVEPESIERTVLHGKEIQIGDTRYKAYTSMQTMAVNMEEGGGIKYIFKEISVFQLAFVFPVNPESIVSLDFLGQSIDLSRTALDLSGDWEGTSDWPELTFSVSFSVDKNSMYLSGVKVVVECKQGEPKTKAMMTVDKKVRIDKDGYFQVLFEPTKDTLSGKFVSPNLVSGDFKGSLSAQCGARMVKVTGKWSIKK